MASYGILKIVMETFKIMYYENVSLQNRICRVLVSRMIKSMIIILLMTHETRTLRNLH